MAMGGTYWDSEMSESYPKNYTTKLLRWGIAFAFIDILFLIIYTEIGNGHINPPDWLGGSWLVMGELSRVAKIIHLPVDSVFGPHLFPYFRSHGGGVAGDFAWTLYLLLCIAWAFLLGVLFRSLILIFRFQK